MHFITTNEKNAIPIRVYLQYAVLIFSIFPTGNMLPPASVVQLEAESPVESGESTEAFFVRGESRHYRTVAPDHRGTVVLSAGDGETMRTVPAAVCAYRGHRLSNGMLSPLLL